MPDLCRRLDHISRDLQNIGIELLTIDGRIILYLMNNGPSRIKELMLATGSSYRGFYLALERLKTKQLIEATIDPEDRRARIVQLAATGPAPSVHRPVS